MVSDAEAHQMFVTSEPRPVQNNGIKKHFKTKGELLPLLCSEAELKVLNVPMLTSPTSSAISGLN
jgi:hypothetical protein